MCSAHIKTQYSNHCVPKYPVHTQKSYFLAILLIYGMYRHRKQWFYRPGRLRRVIAPPCLHTHLELPRCAFWHASRLFFVLEITCLKNQAISKVKVVKVAPSAVNYINTHVIYMSYNSSRFQTKHMPCCPVRKTEAVRRVVNMWAIEKEVHLYVFSMLTLYTFRLTTL